MTEQNTQPASVAGEYRIARSLQLAAILTAGHCGVIALILLLEIAPAWQTVIVALLVASLVYELRTTALRLGATAVIALRISSDHAFSVQTRRGGWHECEVLGSTYVTAFLTVLILRLSGARRVRSVVLMSDSMAAEDFRRLRVWLRWRPQANPD
jgi:toxin CptA